MVAASGTRPLRTPRRSHRARTALAVAAAVVGVVLLLSAGVLLRGRGPEGVPAGGGSAPPSASGAAASAPVDLAPYLITDVEPAPPLDLFDPDGNPFALTATPGEQTLVFFGYTHCPDVCPATTGILGEAIRAYGPGVRAAFVSIDPERDTGEWLREYARFLPRGVTALTGEPGAVRAAADAWGVKYAKVDTGDPDAYTMAHTADVFLVDAAGRLRAKFPFGTESEPIVAALRHVAASTPTASPAVPPPPASASGAPALALRPRVVSSSIWAEPSSPVIFAIDGPAGPLNDPAADVSVQVLAADGTPTGAAVPAVAVQPPGVDRTYFVANLDIPSPGAWRFALTARAGAVPLQGTTGLVTALGGGSTPAIGEPAPAVSTPSLQDVDGDIRLLTTDPAPESRLSERSTGDALAVHDPFVLVLDSYRFKATPACGRALGIVKYLVDRWPEVAFIHHEPYRYSLVTDTPVLEGSLTDPVLTDASVAWGIDGEPWDALSMPWVFVVDHDGTVRAKYQGVVGSEDLDVILALMAAED